VDRVFKGIRGIFEEFFILGVEAEKKGLGDIASSIYFANKKYH
jgi:hypothetical protein